MKTFKRELLNVQSVFKKSVWSGFIPEQVFKNLFGIFTVVKALDCLPHKHYELITKCMEAAVMLLSHTNNTYIKQHLVVDNITVV